MNTGRPAARATGAAEPERVETLQLFFRTETDGYVEGGFLEVADTLRLLYRLLDHTLA
jgi:hypothetical protein